MASRLGDTHAVIACALARCRQTLTFNWTSTLLFATITRLSWTQHMCQQEIGRTITTSMEPQTLFVDSARRNLASEPCLSIV